ncbi:probable methyltransferase-like protein 24 [Macrobrachium nipponense]|uniref:probable methyltransferase-like protein 24 n=1 Tax=Macrobrachium nipponense TaxID=159736 RepID=UPI0030C8BA87
MIAMTGKQFFAGAVALVVILTVWSRPQVIKEVVQTSGAVFIKEVRRMDLKVCPIPATPDYKKFREVEVAKQLPCKNFSYFGVGDGSKGVCLDKEYQLQPGRCNVLSFGINNDWTFDDHFGKFGCKVYSFDPTIGKEDHQHSPNVTFYNLGISSKKGTVDIGGKMCEVDTYSNILERLGLKDSVIDYLKMDVEYAEYEFFKEVFSRTPDLLLNVRQIGMETHHGRPGDLEFLWKHYHLLGCIGFRIVDCRQYANRAEILWTRPGP